MIETLGRQAPHPGLAAKMTGAAEAVDTVRNGDRVYVGTACATPRTLVAALEARRPVPADIQLIHFLTTGVLSNEDGSPATRFRQKSFFIGSDVRQAAACGIAEYVTGVDHAGSEIGRQRSLCARRSAYPNVTARRQRLLQLGVSVDVTAAMVRRARSVIAEINPQVPRTMVTPSSI